MIKAGLAVEIIDAQTKEDVTAFVLTQIILEEAKKKNFLLPVPVLHLIIRYGDNALGEFMEKYLQKTIQNYLKFKTAFDEQMKKWLEARGEYVGFHVKINRYSTAICQYDEFFLIFKRYRLNPGSGESENNKKADKSKK